MKKNNRKNILIEVCGWVGILALGIIFIIGIVYYFNIKMDELMHKGWNLIGAIIMVITIIVHNLIPKEKENTGCIVVLIGVTLALIAFFIF